MTTPNNTLTIPKSSLQLARLLDKPHDATLKRIDGILSRLQIDSTPYKSVYKDANGGLRPCFILDDRLARTLLVRASDELAYELVAPMAPSCDLWCMSPFTGKKLKDSRYLADALETTSEAFHKFLSKFLLDEHEGLYEVIGGHAAHQAQEVYLLTDDLANEAVKAWYKGDNEQESN